MSWQSANLRRVGLVLLAGLGLRLLLFHFRPPISGDSLVYGDIATNMLQHHTYAITQDGVVKATLIRLPGYPIFLALCFMLFGHGNFLAAISLQVLFSLGEAYLLALLASRLMGVRAGWAALILAALCPFTANYSIVPLTEPLTLGCITLALFSFDRWVPRARAGNYWNLWLALIGITITFSVLLRPDRALLCAVLIPAVAWVCYRRAGTLHVKTFAPAVVLALVFMAPLALWGARNWRVFHVVQPLSPKYANDPGDKVALGFMRWYRTWGIDYKNTVEVYWPYDGSIVNFKDIPQRAFDNQNEEDRTEQLIAQYNDETGSTPPVDAAFGKLAQERIANGRLRYYLWLPLARLADMWFQPRTELLKMPLDWWRWRAHPGKTSFSVAYVLLNTAYLVLAALGFRRWKQNGFSDTPELAWAMLIFLVLRSILLATLDNAEQRYTLDCFPVILLLASLAFAKPSTNAQHESPYC